MLLDYLALADTAGIFSPVHEIVNSARAYAYADNAGITWLEQCNSCSTAHPPATYASPGTGSTAPWWFTGNTPATKFLGVIGLDITGADNSTRIANVSSTLSTGGVIGPAYYGPRTLVLRALAIASDEEGLQVGISWLQMTDVDEDIDPCVGQYLTYYESCAADPVDQPNRRRMFAGARITAGPEFLEYHRNMSCGGACATFEMTIVCADPTEYVPSGLPLLAMQWAPGEELVDA